jgi:hypothetical protein
MVLEFCKAGNDERSLLLILNSGGTHGRPVEDASAPEKPLSLDGILGDRSEPRLTLDAQCAANCPLADECPNPPTLVQILIWSSIKTSLQIGHEGELLFS